MKAVLGLLVMMLRVSNAVETHCDGRQDGAQCYGALKGSVVIQLMENASEISGYQRKTNKFPTFDGRKDLVSLIDDRFVFIPSNGTFRINDLRRSDGGKYVLESLNSNGKKSSKQTLKLSIQDAVTSVRLISECLSQGEMRASCSSKGGDHPQYSWTLDGRALTDDELLSGNHEDNTITLKRNVSGRLVCLVKNNVSSVSKGQKICSCGEQDHDEETAADDPSPLMCGLRAAVVIPILIGISIYFSWKKKRDETTEESEGLQMMEHPENTVVMVEIKHSATYANT